MRLCCLLTFACAAISLGRATLIGSATIGSTAIGSAPYPNVSPVGALYTIDPLTGNTTRLGRNFFLYGLGDSPFPGVIFGSSPINLYTLNIFTGAFTNFNNQGDLELAYDSDHGIMYGSNYSSLFTISMTRCDGGCPPILPSQSFPSGSFWAMGYVPGDGLYGVDSVTGNLFRINPANAALTFIASTGIGLATTGFGITDIEYDSETGSMIAVAGGPESFNVSVPPLAFGKIYRLDWHDGSVTLLNDRSPNFFSLAEVAPEPSSLVLTGIAAIFLGLRVTAYRSRRPSSRTSPGEAR